MQADVVCTNDPGEVGRGRNQFFLDAVAALRPEHIRLGDVRGAERGSVALGVHAVMPDTRNVLVRGTMPFLGHPAVSIYGTFAIQVAGNPQVSLVVLNDNIAPVGAAVIGIFQSLSVASAVTNIPRASIVIAIQVNQSGLSGFTADGRPLLWFVV
jgi:hypothetical protein